MTPAVEKSRTCARQRLLAAARPILFDETIRAMNNPPSTQPSDDLSALAWVHDELRLVTAERDLRVTESFS